ARSGLGSAMVTLALAAATVVPFIAADFFARYTKKLATPPSTEPITPSKVKIPQFIPAASALSDLPKHAEHAEAEEPKPIIMPKATFTAISRAVRSRMFEALLTNN